MGGQHTKCQRKNREHESFDINQRPPQEEEDMSSLKVYNVPSSESTSCLEVYNVPLSESTSHLEVYDVPPSESTSHLEVYDVPPSESTSHLEVYNEVYDVPPSESTSHLEVYDVPPSPHLPQQRESQQSKGEPESTLPAQAEIYSDHIVLSQLVDICTPMESRKTRKMCKYDAEQFMLYFSYCLCNIYSLDVSESNPEYVKRTFAHILVPLIISSGSYANLASNPQLYFDIWGDDLPDEFSSSYSTDHIQPRSAADYCQLRQDKFSHQQRMASEEVSSRLRRKWEQREALVLEILRCSLKRHGIEEYASLPFVRSHEDLKNSTDEDIADELTELANSIAHSRWWLVQEELKSLLSHAAAIVRGRIEAQLVAEVSRDSCPAAEGWFCFLMVVWSKLRGLLTDSRHEAGLFRACVTEETVPVPAFFRC